MAPIALYPDALVAQVLMAATYPLDVVQADRWLDDHEQLKGEDLNKAAKGQPWDDSVKALVFFPSVLGFMSDNLDWTQDLGDAVLAQEGDLTDTIQRLRREAQKAGALASTEQQRVEKAGDTIIIQPAKAETVYVPSYDPAKVYGQSQPPTKTYYPDAYADASSSYAATFPSGTLVPSSSLAYPTTTTAVATDTSGNEGLIGFGAGALVGGLLTAAIMWNDHDNDRLYWGGGGYYGGRSYWSQPNYWNNNGWRNPANINANRSIDIDHTVNRGDININKGINGNEINVKKWEHNPERRGGVRYRDAATAQRFAGKHQAGDISRDEARGRLPGADRPLKAPDLGQVRAEGAASGKLAGLSDRQAGGGQVANLKDRPASGEARSKVQAQPRPAAVPKTRPKAETAAAARRPVDRQAKRPAPAEVKRPAAGKIERPAKGAATPRVERPANRPSAPAGRAFNADKPRMDRAASNRGASSRTAAGRPNAGRANAGAARGGGGGGGRRGR